MEKYLKAYLVLKGIDFPYTHNISHLLELCGGQAQWAQSLNDAEELTPYAISTRYPGDEDLVTQEEARRAVKIAHSVQEVVRQALYDEGMPL